MSTELETKKVYDGMSPALATTLQGMAEDLRNLIRRTADDLFRIGAIMYDVSQSLKGDNFSDWCDQELGIKRSTAYNYLQIYKRFSSHVNSPEDILGSIDATAMLTLSGKSVPEYIVEEAIDKAKAGEKIGDIEAKEMIQDGKKKEKEFLEELKEKEKEEVRPQDRVGNEIPDRLIARFEQQKHTEAIKLMSSKIQEAAFEIQNAGIVPLNFESVIGRAKYIWNEADAFSPILVCRKCRGSGEGCSHCHGEGCTRAVR